MLAFDIRALKMHLDQHPGEDISVSQDERHFDATQKGGAEDQRDFLQDEEGRRESVAAFKEASG